MSGDVLHLVIGPPMHGVVRYGSAVYGAAEAEGLGHDLVRVDGIEGALAAELPECGLVHIHVTDRLFGSSAPQALNALQALIGTVDAPVSVTLHDLPQPSDGPAMAGRVNFYRTVLDLVAGVIVSSEHEHLLLREFVDPNVDAYLGVEVVPLMIDPPIRPILDFPLVAQTIGVLGFLYPGKGHIETLLAMEGLPSDVGFAALGMPSPGHEYLVDELRSAAAVSGRECIVSGFLRDDELRQRMWEVTVPVANHRHLSASGSINTWISAGRRPLVPRTRYIEEFDRRSPGLVTIHDDADGALDAAIVAAVNHPAGTWTSPSAIPSPSPTEVANRYDTLLRRWCA